MSGPDIRIKIGVSLDANPGAILAPLDTAVKRARKSVEQEMAATGKAMGAETAKGARQAAKEAASAARAIEREEKRKQGIIRVSSEMAGREAAKAASAEIREKQRSARETERAAISAARRQTRERVRLEQVASREIAKVRAIEERRPERTSGGGAIGIGRRAGIRVNRRTALGFGLAGSALSSAASAGMDFASGLGYDTDLQSHVREAADQQAQAQKISNSGKVPGASLVDPSEILAKAREVGTATGTSASDALGALKDFVGKTGDLKTGMDSLEQMARLSKATGTSLEDMANASAEVSNQLGNVPDKAGAVYAIMKQVAGEGKLGAVEIRDLARQMAKIGAASSRFVGGAQSNIATLGAIAQEAKLRGGASSASQAAQSVVAFAGGFATKATFKNWQNFRAPVPGHPGKFEGLNPFTDSKHTELADPMKLIEGALSATRGDQTKLAQLFPSKQGFRAVAGFASVYNQAAAGTTGDAEAKNTAGIKAVTAEFERLRQAQLDEAEVTRAFTASMQTAESKSTVFNNKMTAVAGQLSESLLPAIEPAGAALVSLAGSAANAATGLANLLSGHNAAQDKQSDTAFGAVTDNTDAHNRAAQGTVDPKTGKRVISGNAFDVLREDSKSRAALIKKQREQIAAENAQAKSAGDEASLFGDVGGFKATARIFTGQKSAKDEAQEAHDRAGRDESVLKVLEAKNEETNRLLQIIAEGIHNQTVVISRPPPPSARPEPGASPNAQTEDQ